MNERIRAREIRVIDDNGTQLGIMAPMEALKIAREQNLDLVEISPTAVPPVCKIMDYGKYIPCIRSRASRPCTWATATSSARSPSRRRR